MKRPLLLSILIASVAEYFVDGESRQCDLKAFVPFTFRGITTSAISNGPKTTGFSHMAAAWMAMEHFNARNTSVVPELADQLFQECDTMFQMENTKFFDTSSGGHQAIQLLYRDYGGTGRNFPCALVGPYFDSAAVSVATMAASAGVPHIPSGGQDARLSEELANPYTSVIYPRMSDITSALGMFLLLHERSNFIATLFAFTDTGNQFQEAVGIILDALLVKQRRTFGYLSPTTPIPLQGQTIDDAVGRVKKSGYRTIVVTMDDAVFDLPLIADAAEAHGMNTDDYVWIFLPPFQYQAVDRLIGFPDSLRSAVSPPLPSYANVRKLLTGAAVIHPIDGFQKDFENDKFARAWRSLDETFVERLNTQALAVTPKRTFLAGDYDEATTDYFQTYEPEPGSSYMYDAVMTAGMGACIAGQTQRLSGMANQSILVEEQLKGIRAVNFSGSTGHVEFGLTSGYVANSTSSRLPQFMSVGVFNMYPPRSEDTDVSEGENDFYTLTAVHTDLVDRQSIISISNGDSLADHIRIDEYKPFFFHDGRTTAPELLRDPPDQNYLSPGLRYVGLTMMGFALLCCLLFLVWVFVHRDRRIVVASQPQFLYVLIVGAAMSSLSIFGITTDENWGFTAEQLSRHCMAIVWLACLGHIFTYGALFTKLWRVNKVLQFSRRQINSSHVGWPSGLLMLSALTILTVWQCLDPLKWVRVEIDNVTGESIGQCDSETMRAYIIALAIVMMIPSVLTCVMAWKTKDVDDTYSESSWIFNLVVVQLQVIIVAFPLAIVLRDVSTDGKYIGHLLLLWSMPMSTILFIMVPKVVAQYKASHGMSQSTRVRGSSGGAIRVSGMPGSASTGQRSRGSVSTGEHQRILSNGTRSADGLVISDEFACDDGDTSTGRT